MEELENCERFGHRIILLHMQNWCCL